MKALTLRQPWASLIPLGAKTIETRSWRTNYRGPLAIHAGSGLPRRLRKGDSVRFGGYEVQRDASGLLMRSDRLGWPYRLPLGFMVATCTLADVVPILAADESPDHAAPHVDADARILFGAVRGLGYDWSAARKLNDEWPYGDYTPGRWAWILTDITPITLVQAYGRQGLWDWCS